MKIIAISLIAATGLLLAPLRADFSYEQTTKITGGSMLQMMRMVPGGGKALEPQLHTVLIQGNRMATVSAKDIQIVDLDKETMTRIDLDKRTYSVITFAEFRDAIQSMQRKMQRQSDPAANLDFKLAVKDTGKTQQIRSLETKEKLLIISAEMKDPKSGQSGTMEIQSDIWLAKSVPGYQEVRDFHLRYAQKLASGTESLRLGAVAMQPGMGEGMARMAKEAAKLDGVPILQIMTMKGVGGAGMPNMSGSGATPQGANASEEAKREAARAAQNEAAAEAARASGGRLGGLAGTAAGGMLGGLGRRKKDEPRPASSTPGTAPADSGALMETTTEMTSFASGPVDASKFAVPAGFKEVEHEMKKISR